MLNEVNGEKRGRKFWDLVNKGRKIKNGVDDSIGKKEWMNYFLAQMGEKEELEEGE